jgi:Na+/H+ antiporter NhaD/arsenite permease-like protein
MRYRLPSVPFLLALATSANTGSVATLVGNPQNMLCGLLGGLSYRDHLLLLGPVATGGLAINHAVLWLMFRKSIGASALLPVPAPMPPRGRARLTLGVIAATALAYTLGGNLAWTAATGFVFLMLAHRRDTRELWSRIDWALLLFFAGLFIVVEGLLKSGAPGWLFERFPLDSGAAGLAGWARLTAIFLVGSNIVSNVPFILVVRDQMGTLPNPTFAWELLAMASTFAGNLTLLGSVANIIVVEAGREVGGMGFFQYLRVGLPLTLLTTLVGALWLVLAGT